MKKFCWWLAAVILMVTLVLGAAGTCNVQPDPPPPEPLPPGPVPPDPGPLPPDPEPFDPPEPAPIGEPFEGRVIRTDGPTIVIVRVRLLQTASHSLPGIEGPTDPQYAEAAEKALETLTRGETITSDGVYVRTEDGTQVCQELVRQGWATARDDAVDTDLRNAESEARLFRRGMWQ